jgi:hypothetical protein
LYVQSCRGCILLPRGQSMHSNVWISPTVRHYLRWILATSTVAACGRQTVSLPKSTSTTVPIPNQDTAAAEFRSLPGTFSPGEERYNAQITSSVQLTGDSSSRVDSTHLTGQIAITFATAQATDHVIATVRIDSVTVRSSNNIVGTLLPNRTFLFNVDRRTGQVIRTIVDPQPLCTKDTTALPFDGTEVLPTIRVRPSPIWIDTSHTEICRGEVLLRVTRITTYSTTPTVNQSIAQIARSSRVTVSGSGFQWSQKVDASGEGVTSDTLFFSPSSRLERVSGTSSLRLAFRSPFRTQQFLQLATTSISTTTPNK